jgi:hypothetical protein
MSEHHHPTDAEVQAFVDNIRQLRSTLSPPEQHILDAVLLTAAGEDAAVQGYGLDGTAAKRAAMMAVVALGLAVGGMSSPGAGTAHASELAQGGGRGSSQSMSQQGSGQQGSGQQGSGNRGSGQQGSGQQGSGHQGNSGSGSHQGNGHQGSGQHSNNHQGSGQHSNNHQGSGQHSNNHQQWSGQRSGNHWNRVPSSFQHYYGPRYTYSHDWYFHRHISFPNLYQVVYEEPAEGVYDECYFYEGAFYCFVG